MAVVEVTCPGCQATFQVPDRLAGKKAKCKKCGTPIRIPGPAADAPPKPGAASPVTPAADNPFDFASAADEPPAPKKPARQEPPAKPRSSAKLPRTAAKAPPPAPVELPPEAEEPLAEELPAGEAASGPADPFAFAAGESPDHRREDDFARLRDSLAVSGRKERGSGRVLLLAGVLGLLAVGGGIAAAVVYFNRQQPEQAQADNKDEKKDAGPPAGPATNPGPTKEPAKGPTEAKPGEGKAAPGKAGPRAAGGVLRLPPGRTITVQPPAEKMEMTQGVETRVVVDAPFGSVRRVFPPAKQDLDIGVVWQPAGGFQKTTLNVHAPSGRVVNRVEFDGDGKPDPACDLSLTADVFAYATADGKVTVVSTRDPAKKLLDRFDPYADQPDHKKAGLAAVFLTEPPEHVVTVSTAGAVHAFEIATKKPAGEFVPPKPVPNRVAGGKSVAINPGRRVVFVAAGGVVYRVTVHPAVSGEAMADLGGDVGRSLGLAASGGGRVVYAFETADPKKERAVTLVAPDGGHSFYRLPDAAGEPVGAGWGGDGLAAIPTARGAAVWFEVEGNRFEPLALVTTPGDKALHAPLDNHWSLLPDPDDPKKSVLVEVSLPPQGLIDVLLTTQRPVHTLRLDDKGVHK